MRAARVYRRRRPALQVRLRIARISCASYFFMFLVRVIVFLSPFSDSPPPPSARLFRSLLLVFIPLAKRFFSARNARALFYIFACARFAKDSGQGRRKKDLLLRFDLDRGFSPRRVFFFLFSFSQSKFLDA